MIITGELRYISMAAWWLTSDSVSSNHLSMAKSAATTKSTNDSKAYLSLPRGLGYYGLYLAIVSPAIEIASIMVVKKYYKTAPIVPVFSFFPDPCQNCIREGQTGPSEWMKVKASMVNMRLWFYGSSISRSIQGPCVSRHLWLL